jgi:uncharacterized membrane protein
MADILVLREAFRGKKPPEAAASTRGDSHPGAHRSGRSRPAVRLPERCRALSERGRPVTSRRASTYRWSWLAFTVETVIIIASTAYVVTGRLPVLMTWLVIAVLYLTVGGTVVWRSSAHDLEHERPWAHWARRWAWLLPVLSSAVGAYSAVIALAARADASMNTESALLAGAASLGVALSWMLLQVGFANIYRYISLTDDSPAIRFPGPSAPSPMDYLYFSFTIGASFATSDAQIDSPHVRRVVAVHSVVSFFYNALVVAVAFQVLQQVISG